MPDTEKMRVPVERFTPIAEYHSPPRLMMCGTVDMVSTLLTIVGAAYTPCTAGNGGLMRGMARSPSRLESSPVSSPAM